MKNGYVLRVLLAAAALTASSCGEPRPTPEREPTRANVLDAARSIMSSARFCALVTVDAEGQPRARTMAPYPPQEDMVVWLATRPGTRKVEQIRDHPQVTLYYFDAVKSEYATLLGRARLVDDLAAKQRWRSRVSEELYPAWPDDYLLIEVTPERIEVQGRDLHPDPITWLPAAVTFDLDR